MKKAAFDRISLLVGEEAMSRISQTKVIIFGIGGVGSWVAECLIRTGIENITLVDSDKVSVSNINRQMPATVATIGEVKTLAAKRRLLEINPEAAISVYTLFYSEDTSHLINLSDYDVIVDAIDSLKDKALLILNATRSGRKFYSSMGAALKLDPTKVKVAEFWNVKGCPLARALRQKFKREREFPARKFLCVYSDEVLDNRGVTFETCEYKACINGSLCHITAIFGMTIAGEIIKDIVESVESP
ncbi:MAG: tRNA threonylcarbamoyladenosine dehydratase [Muribaculaceae bacterium]|nr:tRNA threonylcarbamoyladenosine dehydratase [Muribaculaceae bacterium]